jgi:NADPH:quinone reductase
VGRLHPEDKAKAQAALNEMYLAGKIKPTVGRSFALRECPQALRALANREIMGKAVLVNE